MSCEVCWDSPEHVVFLAERLPRTKAGYRCGEGLVHADIMHFVVPILCAIHEVDPHSAYGATVACIWHVFYMQVHRKGEGRGNVVIFFLWVKMGEMCEMCENG